jgi:hypothetical protein
MGYVVKHSTLSVNNARRKGNVALGVDADGYDKTSVSGFYAGVAPVPGFHNLVRTSASDDPDFYTLTDLELVNFANSLGGSVTDVTGAKVYLASRNDIMFTDDIPDDTEVDGLVLELDASKLSSYPESGNTWYDLSGNGINGTLTNGPTFSHGGVVGTTTPLTQNRWNYLAVRYNAGNVQIYINGVAGTMTGTATGYNIVNNSASNSNLYLGCYRNLSYNLHGNIGLFRIYNRALTQTEITQNYYQAPIVTDNLYAAFDSDNLVSYESGSDTIYNLADVSNTDHDGVINSDVDFTLSNTLAFGKDRNTNIYHSQDFDFPGWDGYSVGIWVKRTKYGTWQSGTTNYDGIWNYYWNHNLHFSGLHTGNNRIQGTGLSGYDIDFNKWYYVVTTHDNNAVSNNHKVYINGELEQTSHISNAEYDSDGVTPKRFYVGNWDSGWSMVGEIGAYHIYDQAITADEVLQNYNTYKSRYQNQDPTLEIDGDWLKVFRHYSGDGDFFSSSNDWAEAKNTNTDNPQANKYSILDTLYRYELDGKFTFKLVYPSQSLENPAYSNVTNIWSQTNNPVRDNGLGGVTGYTAIDIDSVSSGWGGLERYDAQSATFLDGTLIPQGNWWWAIGSKNAYDGGNPNFPGPGYTTRLVELWVKYK